MNAKVEQQYDAEIALCEAVANLIRGHKYSVYDVRYAVGAFTGQILGDLRNMDPGTAAELSRPRLSLTPGPESLKTRWTSHSRRNSVNA